MALDPTLLIGLKVLEPYLDDLVIAGGWVPYLYAAHEQPSEEAVGLKTRDLDLAVPQEVPQREKTIDQLLGEAGFTCELRSLDAPPGTHYVATHEGHEVEKDLYYIFYVMDGFRAWHPWIREESTTLATVRPGWRQRGLRSLAASFETPTSSGVDALLNQRPGTAYPGLDDDQFRQYAWSVMQELLKEG